MVERRSKSPGRDDFARVPRVRKLTGPLWHATGISENVVDAANRMPTGRLNRLCGSNICGNNSEMLLMNPRGDITKVLEECSALASDNRARRWRI